jgi:NADH:ubiquinone oxidoreductase subunit E
MKTVEKILLKYDPDITNLLPALKEISAAFGYVSRADAGKIAAYFSVPLSKVFETATFYDEIKVRKDPALVIEVCSSSNCALGNSLKVIKEIENIFHIKEGDDFNPKVRLKAISCLGRCGEGPIIIVNGKVYANVTTSLVHGILAEYL